MILAFLFAALMTRPADEFFIISSVDTAHNKIVLKRPTEVTVVVSVPPNATLRGERNEQLHIADLRAGDTIYAVVTPSMAATSIRRGPMTIEELRRRYLRPPN